MSTVLFRGMRCGGRGFQNRLIDGNLEVGKVKGKEEAKKEYERAKETGATAGLVAQKPRETDLFETSVNVKAGGEVKFNLTYQQVLKRSHGVYKHIANIIDSQGVEDVKIDVYVSERGKIAKLKIPQFAPKMAEKTNKELLGLPENTDAVVRRSEGEGTTTIHVSFSPPKNSNGQLALLYDTEKATKGGEIEVSNGYFVHFFAPKKSSNEIVSTNFVFVLDCSRSMQGTKFTQLQTAMDTIIPHLQATDHFSVVYFSSESKIWSQTLKPATQRNKNQARQFVKQQVADGKTNIYDALQDAVRILKASTDNERPSVVLFLTDGVPTAGEVTDAEGIRKTVGKINPQRNIRIHSLSFGNDADFPMLKRLSRENNGLARKIYEASDAALQLDGFYSEIALPIYTELNITYLNNAVNVSSLVKNREDNALYEGSEVMVVGKLRDSAHPDLQLRGAVKGKANDGTSVLFRCGIDCLYCCSPGRTCPEWCGGIACDRPLPTLPPPVPVSVLPAYTLGGFLERMWAYLTIKKYLEEAEISPDKKSKLEEKAKNLALNYNFVTKLTSLVIVDKEANLKPFEREDEFDIGPSSFGSVGAMSFMGRPSAGTGSSASFSRAKPAIPAPKGKPGRRGNSNKGGGSNIRPHSRPAPRPQISEPFPTGPPPTTMTPTTIETTTLRTTAKPQCDKMNLIIIQDSRTRRPSNSSVLWNKLRTKLVMNIRRSVKRSQQSVGILGWIMIMKPKRPKIFLVALDANSLSTRNVTYHHDRNKKLGELLKDFKSHGRDPATKNTILILGDRQNMLGKKLKQKLKKLEEDRDVSIIEIGRNEKISFISTHIFQTVKC